MTKEVDDLKDVILSCRSEWGGDYGFEFEMIHVTPDHSAAHLAKHILSQGYRKHTNEGKSDE
jgi:hypothetical protein